MISGYTLILVIDRIIFDTHAEDEHEKKELAERFDSPTKAKLAT
jgi:hypothetical protein